LDKVWLHPVFVAAYLFIGITVALEFTSPLSDYGYIVSFALMIGGASLVASLCRDRAALKMLMYGYIGAGLWLGAYLVLTSYGTLSGAVVTGYVDASQARVGAFKDASMQGNLNGLATHCVQGAVVALVFAIGSVWRRTFFAAIGIFCLVATSLTMSRGAIINLVVSIALVFKAYGLRQGKVWLLIAVLGAGAVFLIPDAVWLRMTVVTEKSEQGDARVFLYKSAMQHVDDYLFSGVGAGNYFQKWALEKGIGVYMKGSFVVAGTHNSFLQILIYWGLIGLLAYVAVIWLAYRCLPRIYSNDWLVLGILGIAVSTFLVLPFSHDFSYKGLGLGLGMLVAYQRWIAPSNAAPPASR
jgi:O-antigen ligase